MKHNQKRQKSTKSQAKLYMYVNLLFFFVAFQQKIEENKQINFFSFDPTIPGNPVNRRI